MLTKNSLVAINHFLPLIRKQPDNLRLLYDHLQQFEPSYHKTSDKNSKQKVILTSLADEPFIDDHLKKYITQLTHCRKVLFKTGNTTYTLQIYHKGEILDNLIHTLMYTLSFVHMLSKHTMKDIHIKYYLLDVKRILDGDTYFDKEEVNGGVCRSSAEHSEITIWRKEEILKVSIHELIHALSYDYKQDTSDIIQHYQRKYGITSTKMNTYEAYTEIYAELLHSFIISHIYHKINPTFNPYYLFDSNVGIEIEFSQLQATKILSLLDMNKDMNKATNVCAYYIIKLELYKNIYSFIQFCLTYNKDIIKLIDTSKYFEYLKSLTKLHKKKYKVSGYLKNTTRMTCLEIDLF
jgi:hypothetical protein